jgi:beta-lactamase class A
MNPRMQATLRAELAGAGLVGSVVVRDLESGEQLALDGHEVFPVASLVKLPLAVAVAERIEAGTIDPAEAIEVAPTSRDAPGPTGLARFRHPARLAIEDLLYLSTCVSDNAAAEALLALVPPALVGRELERIGISEIAVRHGLTVLSETPAERLDADDLHLAHELAIGAATVGGGHRIAQLDVAKANTGTAIGFADLLTELWRPRHVSAGAAARVRDLMRHNMIRHRLAPDFTSDAMTWASKTGTLLNLRHEAGVVEHADGQQIAVVVLTESHVAAADQPGAEAQMAHVARQLHDELRRQRR